MRYKKPKSSKSKLIEQVVKAQPIALENTSDDFRFSAAVAGFGMLLRNSDHKGESTWELIYQLAKNAKGKDELGYRGELLRLIESAKLLTQSIEKTNG